MQHIQVIEVNQMMQIINVQQYQVHVMIKRNTIVVHLIEVLNVLVASTESAVPEGQH